MDGLSSFVRLADGDDRVAVLGIDNNADFGAPHTGNASISTFGCQVEQFDVI